jgi:hypothetical protein
VEGRLLRPEAQLNEEQRYFSFNILPKSMKGGQKQEQQLFPAAVNNKNILSFLSTNCNVVSYSQQTGFFSRLVRRLHCIPLGTRQNPTERSSSLQRALLDKKYRFAMTDGVDKYNQGMIFLRDGDKLPKKGNVVDLGVKSRGASKNKMVIQDDRNILVVHNFTP